MADARPAVVVDWDGTVTEIDVLHLVLLRFGDERTYEEHEERLGRELTLHEVIAGEFETELVDMDGDWTYLRNEKGALLQALRRLKAGGAPEVLVGGTADGQFLIHVRR
jgi:hypothetical protein